MRYAPQRVFRVTFLQRPAVAKQRFAKRYRHPDLDARLTKTRLLGVRARRATRPASVCARVRRAADRATPQEARSLLKARKLGVATPVLYHVDAQAACLYMEFVPGPMVKERLFAGLDAAGARRCAPRQP